MPRRSYQQLFELAILSVLDKTIARNVEDIRRKVSEKLGKSVSWNTIKKIFDNIKRCAKNRGSSYRKACSL